jgi:hypothetical protein
MEGLFLMARLTGEGTICMAQHVLDFYDITMVSAHGLAELLSMKTNRAAYILSQLGWERIVFKGALYIWKRNGTTKIFDVGGSGSGKRLFNVWKRRNDIDDDDA